MQDKQYVMALDAGTTSNRAIIFDNESHIVSVSQKEFTQYFPKPGWVEHDANEIFHSMVEVMRGSPGTGQYDGQRNLGYRYYQPA